MNSPIISHKKSLRVSRLTKDRELLLNRYTDESTSSSLNNNNNDNNEGSKESVSEDNDIKQEEIKPNFKELIQTHNKLLGKEQDTNNLIKSTIYDNYYDLIRVNKSLEQFIDPQGDINIMWDKLKNNLLSD